MLAIVLIDWENTDGHYICYVRCPFMKAPELGAASINYDLNELLERAVTVEASL